MYEVFYKYAVFSNENCIFGYIQLRWVMEYTGISVSSSADGKNL